ncbi:MAG: hypothetical protein E6K60_03275 [Nitrospirae bacterium]|nr:MAG: hypothetical protein E6K60_03275 [Nitrospirota bacterium]
MKLWSLILWCGLLPACASYQDAPIHHLDAVVGALETVDRDVKLGRLTYAQGLSMQQPIIQNHQVDLYAQQARELGIPLR